MRPATPRAMWMVLLGAAASCSPAPAPPATDGAPGNGGPPAISPPGATSAPANDASIDPPLARELRASLVRKIRDSGPPWGGGRWDPRVLEAMQETPRHLFAPNLSIAAAYEDRPQPIGHGQTISQPAVVALMTNALDLRGPERVLEIGTGSGYQAAVLSRLARQVFTIEIVAPLGEMAKERLARLGHANVEVRIGDGYKGWPEQAPFDRILITAAPPEIPSALVDQLADGGVLVAPVGGSYRQKLVRWTRRGSRIDKEDLGDVMFVPMVPGSAQRD